MCLVVTNKEKKEADSVIKCYKVVKYTAQDGYKTPCTEFNISMPIIKGERLLIALGDEFIRDNDFEHYTEVDGGFIHVFETKTSAALYADILNMFNSCPNGYEYKVFKCIIPKGTKYYKGTFNYYCGKMSCYAAKQVMFCEEIDWREVLKSGIMNALITTNHG